QYLIEWLSTSQPDVFPTSVAESTRDPKTIAELWEDHGQTVGFLWVTFYEIVDYSITVAEVRDLEVSPEFHRRGIGTQMLEHAENVVRSHGADLLRSETETANVASQRMHEKYGFATYHLQYEKLLTELPRKRSGRGACVSNFFIWRPDGVGNEAGGV
ncbi:MAG: GNAT family N-acetyltransferase, partial [Planctomycetes bacterium]|nr:GNAT family N-acetyltransferase [Planctomycetota bacterium]